MLYIVGTPIGNLEDLSLRQARILTSVNIVYAEDTRNTYQLLMRLEGLFGLKRKSQQKLISFYKDVEYEKVNEILELAVDQDIAVVSDSGMPLISDPGFLLVKHAIKKNIPFTVIPGPTAITTALVYSGFNPQTHMFIGFLPKKKGEVKKLFQRLQKVKELFSDAVFVAYESAKRIESSLEILESLDSNTQVAIGREMTKKFEEIIRGTPAELKTRTYKGELTLVIS
ncbi:MAG: 16S rRNA (cytidine(1402)-2'-O)-methyltransferase [Patescibacteria group bacterium]